MSKDKDGPLVMGPLWVSTSARALCMLCVTSKQSRGRALGTHFPLVPSA